MRQRRSPLPRTARRILYNRAGILRPLAEIEAVADGDRRLRRTRPREILRQVRAR